MVDDVMEIAVIVLALAAGAFVKGVSGTGLPQVAIPVMAAFLGVDKAVIIMSIPGTVANVWMVAAHARSASESRDLRILLVTGMTGAVLGTILLTSVDAELLSLLLGSLILVYVVLRVRSPDFSLRPSRSVWLSPPVGFVAGALQGTTGISGPLLSTYLHSFRLARSTYIFSLSSLFLGFSLTQVVTLATLGAYSTRLILEGTLALLPVALLLPVGARLSRRLDPRRFSAVVMVGLVLAAIALLGRAFANWLT